MQEGFPAHFSDGRNAGRISAQLVLAPGRLEVRGPDGRMLAGWRYKDVRLQNAVRPGEPMRLASINDPDARLTVLNEQAIADIRGRLEAIGGSHGGLGKLARGAAWLAAAAAGAGAVLWGLYAALPAIADPIARAIPVSWEEKMGDNMVKSALADKQSCGASDGSKALDALAVQIAAANGLERRFKVHLIQDATVNAFALPGGHVVLLSGLLKDAQNPDEVAGVLAHEMAHVVERHSAERMVRAAGVGLLFTWLTGDPSSIIAGAGALLVNLSYSRSDEAEADARAVAMLEAAGFSTGGLNSFFLRLAEHNKMEEVVPELLSSHPRSTERAAAHAARNGTRPLTDAQWQAVKAACPGRGK